MRNLINKIYNKFSKKNNKNNYNDNIENICINPNNDLKGYCSLEYTYNKR